MGHLKKCIRLAVIRWSRGISAILLDGMFGCPDTQTINLVVLITGDLAVQVLCQTYKVGEEKIPDMLGTPLSGPWRQGPLHGMQEETKRLSEPCQHWLLVVFPQCVYNHLCG